VKKLVKHIDGEQSESRPLQQLNGDEEREFVFLDGLRESGVVNMFGASPYLEESFPSLNHEEAIKVLSKWMETFGSRERARVLNGVKDDGERKQQ